MPRKKLQRLEKRLERVTKRAEKSISRYKKDAEKRTPDVSISGILPRIVTSNLEARAKHRSARASALKKKVEKYKSGFDGVKKEGLPKGVPGSINKRNPLSPKRTAKQKIERFEQKIGGLFKKKDPFKKEIMLDKLKKTK
jgi:hypothetical protein